MKNKVKFRGKTRSGKWIYGMPSPCFHYIFNEDGLDSIDNYEVDPNTITQFVGISDKNEADVYGGDRVHYKLINDSSGKIYNGVIEYHRHAWRVGRIWLLTEISEIEVIDN